MMRGNTPKDADHRSARSGRGLVEGCSHDAPPTGRARGATTRRPRAREAPTGPYADWEYHVAATEGVIPHDVEQMLAALRRRVEELSEHRQLTALRVAARIEQSAPRLSLGAVRAARGGPVSWEATGRTFGTSRQAAHERFARHIKGWPPGTAGAGRPRRGSPR